MRWLIAGVAFVGLIQAVVWIGRPKTPGGRRVLAVFAAPVALIVLAVAVAAHRVPALMF